jgi:hypothetical protein
LSNSMMPKPIKKANNAKTRIAAANFIGAILPRLVLNARNSQQFTGNSTGASRKNQEWTALCSMTNYAFTWFYRAWYGKAGSRFRHWHG